jgi:hypothetical protein
MISRKDGILDFDTDRPYKMAIAGEQQPRNQIICHDVTSKTENAALDMLQLLTTAIQNAPQSNNKMTKKQLDEADKKDQGFFENESPSLEEIDEQAYGLRVIVQSSKVVKMSEIMDLFFEFVDKGAVMCAGDQKIYRPIWESIHREDKMKIVFRYCAFFVNPLMQLVAMAASMEYINSSKAKKELPMQ